MEASYMDALNAYRDIVQDFKGLNYKRRPAENEFSRASNISNTQYPTLSYPVPYSYLKNYAYGINGMISHEELGMVHGYEFYYAGNKAGEIAAPGVNPGKQQLVSMGANIIIYPAKYMFNTQTYELKPMEYMAEGRDGAQDRVAQVYYLPLFYDKGTGKYIQYNLPEPLGHYTVVKSYTKPTTGDENTLWLKYESNMNEGRLFKYVKGSGDEIVWEEVETYAYLIIRYAYDKADYDDGIKRIRQGSKVEVSIGHNNWVYFSGQFDVLECKNKLGELVGQFYGHEQQLLIKDIARVYGQNISYFNYSYVKSVVPDMDYVTVYGNRLWGCNSAKHEIYASKLGEPTEFFVYDGLVTDSYAATIGTPGAFTGVAGHAGYLYFFKPREIIRVYGTKPANYTCTYITADGCADNSLAEVDGILYYHGFNDFYAIADGRPQRIADALNSRQVECVCACEYDGRYYAMCHEPDVIGKLFFYVYDPRTGTWTQQDCSDTDTIADVDTSVGTMANRNGLLYYTLNRISGSSASYCIGNPALMEYQGLHALYNIFNPWNAITGELGLSYPNNKYVTKIVMRLRMDANYDWKPAATAAEYQYTPSLAVSVSYDGGEWTEVYEEELPVTGADGENATHDNTLRSIVIPIIPHRHDFMRIKLAGRGNFVIYSISKYVEEGSEVR